MATRESFSIGEPCWVDHLTNDAEATRRFYTGVFGWEAGEASPEFGGYFMFLRDGVPVAGAAPVMPGASMPDAWSVYLTVRDVEDTLARAVVAGASVIAPAMPIADLGTMGVLSDPTGAVVGVWAPDTFHGFGVIDEPGAPKWFELHSRDYDAAVPFYREVFSWDARDMDTPDFRYTTANRGDAQVAGVMDADAFLPAGVPSFWTVYFGVADVDAAVAATLALGGTVQQPAMDTPYGRLAGLADPGGAAFSVMQA